MPNVNISHVEMRSAAGQLQAGEQTIGGGTVRMIQGLNGMARNRDAAVKASGDTDAELAASLGQ